MSCRKFTIVIPTRDRCDTLVAAIRSALSQDYPDFSVLVSDNASVDATAEAVASITDPRLRYINTGSRISMSHNWEFALGHVSEGWVALIGDDDALLPGALRRADGIAAATGTRAIRSNGCTYEWPGMAGRKFGRLVLDLRRGYRQVRSGSALQAVLDGRLGYSQLPMLYNGGFVDVGLILEAKAVTGSFFASMIPDVFSAMVFSLLTDDYVYSYEPMAVNGASLHSGGTAEFGKAQAGRKYDPAQKFWSEPNIPFHKDVPLTSAGKPVRSIQALVYESWLQAAPFHCRRSQSVSAEKQLEAILVNASPFRDEVHDWARVFADMHGLSYEAINLRTVVAQGRQNRFASRVRRDLPHLLRTFEVIGNERQPLADVYQAAVEAGRLQAIRPGAPTRLANISNRVRRRLAGR